jgi:hypothetical protein
MPQPAIVQITHAPEGRSGDNLVVGVLRDGHLDARTGDTAAAKCTGFLRGEAARPLLSSSASAKTRRNDVHPDMATLTRRRPGGRGAHGSARDLVADGLAAKSARCGHSYQDGTTITTGRVRAGRCLGAGDVQPSLSGDDVRRVAPCRAMTGACDASSHACLKKPDQHTKSE